MSEYASLELSQELYKLSGWKTGKVERDNPTQSAYNDSNIICYRYDAGYLLRKLPIYVPTPDDLAKHLILHPSDSDRWTAYYTHTTFLEEADSPENALCKLAIELHKAGILPISGRD